MLIRYLDRAQWGADPSLPRLGTNVAPYRRTEVHLHHTAGIDADDTPNEWSADDAIAYMRRLQRMRPDLGLDIPYTECIAVLEDGNTVLIFEGRGPYRRGAHTAGHNTAGLGFSFLGDFSRPTPRDAIDRGLLALRSRLWHLRAGDFTNLGSVQPAGDRQVFGHRDTKATACPGDLLYERLAMFRFTDQIPEEDEPMLTTGSSGPAVAIFQRALMRLGYDLSYRRRDGSTHPGDDGDFGSRTASAAADFRAKQGLTPAGGIIDGVTAALLLDRPAGSVDLTGIEATLADHATKIAARATKTSVTSAISKAITDHSANPDAHHA